MVADSGLIKVLYTGTRQVWFLLIFIMIPLDKFSVTDLLSEEGI